MSDQEEYGGHLINSYLPTRSHDNELNDFTGQDFTKGSHVRDGDKVRVIDTDDENEDAMHEGEFQEQREDSVEMEVASED